MLSDVLYQWVYLCVGMCTCVWMPSEARGVGSPRTGVGTVVSHLAWVLSTKYR